MDKMWWRLTLGITACWLAGCATTPTTAAELQREVVLALDRSTSAYDGYLTNVRARPDRLEFVWAIGEQRTPHTVVLADIKHPAVVMGTQWSVPFRYQVNVAGHRFFWAYEEDAKSFAASLMALKQRHADAPTGEGPTISSRHQATSAEPGLPPEIWHHVDLADMAVQQGDHQAAIEHYHAAMSLAPDWPDGYLNMAQLFARASRFDEAINTMEEFLQRWPESPHAEPAREIIEQWQERRADRMSTP